MTATPGGKKAAGARTLESYLRFRVRASSSEIHEKAATVAGKPAVPAVSATTWSISSRLMPSSRAFERRVVSFSILNRDGGRRYWVTLLPEGSAFDDPSGEVEVPEGAKRVRVTAAAPGPHSVRVLSERGGAKRMVAWRKLNVLP